MSPPEPWEAEAPGFLTTPCIPEPSPVLSAPCILLLVVGVDHPFGHLATELLCCVWGKSPMRQSPPSILEMTNATFAARVKACGLGTTDQTLIGPQRLYVGAAMSGLLVTPVFCS